MRFRRQPKVPAQGIGPADPLPDGFPFELSDDRLDAVLRDMITAIPGFDRYAALLPSSS